jgi:hypothetical protein
MTNPRFYLFLFLLACILLIINLFGFFINLRNDELYEKQLPYEYGISLTEKEFYQRKEQLFDSGLSDSLKAVECTHLVNDGMAHYWDGEIYKYNLTVPAYENYLLFAMSFFHPRIERYEFLNWKKALERGVGECSQHAIILSEILNENGIETDVLMLEGHVVASAQVNPGSWIVIDADFDVVIPYDLSEIEKNPAVVGPYYAEKGCGPMLVQYMINTYGKEGNVVYRDASHYKRFPGVFEHMVYWGIWVIPILLSLPYISLLVKKRKTVRSAFAC